MVANTAFEIAVFEMGGKYYGARSNEFGYANYEILDKGLSRLLGLPKGEFDKEDQSDLLHSKDQVQ